MRISCYLQVSIKDRPPGWTPSNGITSQSWSIGSDVENNFLQTMQAIVTLLAPEFLEVYPVDQLEQERKQLIEWLSHSAFQKGEEHAGHTDSQAD